MPHDIGESQVKYPFLWRLGYTFTQPRIVHVPMQHVMGLIMSRQISEAFDHYQPDLVVSVHPLMQVTRSRLRVYTGALQYMLCSIASISSTWAASLTVSNELSSARVCAGGATPRPPTARGSRPERSHQLRDSCDRFVDLPQHVVSSRRGPMLCGDP